jgi:hypothetical protein
MLKPGVTPEQRRRKPTVNARQVTKHGDNANKLVLSVFDFIRTSHGLENIVLDNVPLTTEQSTKLSDAMAHMHSQLNKLTMTNCPIGSTGMRLLTPAINKLHSMTQLTVRGCGLTDESANFLVSILRASQANMDQLYWNSTLRMSDPLSSSMDSSALAGAVINDETNHVFSSGLLVLDVAENELTSAAVDIMGRQLKNNNWLLVLDLSENSIGVNGFGSLVTALRSGEGPALSTVLMKGNPGFNIETSSAMKDTTDLAPDRLDCMPAEMYEVLKEFQNSQAEEMLGAEAAPPAPVMSTSQVTVAPEEENEREDKEEEEEEGEKKKKKIGGRGGGQQGQEALIVAAAGDAAAARPKSASGGRGGSGSGSSSSRSGDMDFSINPGSPGNGPHGDPALSPAASLGGSRAEDNEAGMDGRPVSRNSLRPRPGTAVSENGFSPAQTPSPGGNGMDSSRSSGNMCGSKGRDGSGSGSGGRSAEASANLPHPGVVGLGDMLGEGVDSIDLLNGPGLVLEGRFRSSSSGSDGGGRRQVTRSFDTGTNRSSSRNRQRGMITAVSTSTGLAMMAAANGEKKPFYPSGHNSAYARSRDGSVINPRARAAKYAEKVRIEQMCLLRPPTPPGNAESSCSSSNKKPVAGKRRKKSKATTVSAAGDNKKTASAAPASGSGDQTQTTLKRVTQAQSRMDRRLGQLTGAVEKVTKQLEATNERMQDLSDSLSDSVLNLSLNNSSRSRDNNSNNNNSGSSSKVKASPSSVTKGTSTATHSIVDVVEAPSPPPSPPKASQDRASNTTESSLSPSTTPRGSNRKSSSGSGSPVSSPSSSPARPRNRDKDVSRVIRSSMREKLDKYLDELQY